MVWTKKINAHLRTILCDEGTFWIVQSMVALEFSSYFLCEAREKTIVITRGYLLRHSDLYLEAPSRKVAKISLIYSFFL